MNITIIIVTIISSIICVKYNTSIEYSYVSFLPLSLLIFNLLGTKHFFNLKRSYVFYIFYLQAIVRYCLIPVGISLDDYLGNGSNSGNGDVAVLFMIVELLLIFFLFSYQNKKFKQIKHSTNIILVTKNYWLYFFVFVMFIIILMSGFFNKVNTIWDLQDYVQQVVIDRDEIKSSSLGGLLFNPFKIAIILIFSSLILRSKRLSKNTKVFFLLVLMGLAGSFIVGVSRFSVIMFILPFYFIIVGLSNKKTKRTINLGLVTILSSVVIVTSIGKFTRGDNEIKINNIITTSTLNAYFAGPGNIASGIDAFEDVVNKNHSHYLINDLFQNVPLISKLTNDKYKSSFDFNRKIYEHSIYRDQIVPLSIAGLFHYDIFGIGFYSVLFLSIAFYFERKGKREKYLPYKYVYFLIMLTLSLVFMLNIGSMIASPFRAFVFTFTPFYMSNQLSKLILK